MNLLIAIFKKEIMITVLVKFKISNELNLKTLKKVYRKTLYVDVEGLLRKNYIADIEKGYAGGVYTFTKIEFAKKWFDEERIKWITERYSKPEITYFESPIKAINK